MVLVATAVLPNDVVRAVFTGVQLLLVAFEVIKTRILLCSEFGSMLSESFMALEYIVLVFDDVLYIH